MARRLAPAAQARRLGSRVRALRLEIALTQEQLAWSCDLDKGYVSQLEAGKRVPSLPVLWLIAESLGVEAADLLGFDVAKPRLQLLDAARRGDRGAFREAVRRLKLE